MIFLFFGRTISVAFVFKIVVIQRFRSAIGAVFKNGAVLVSGNARFGGVHAGPSAARSRRARIFAELTARRFQFGGFS